MASFTKRGNVWQYEISTKDALTGKYKKIRKSGFKTKREAQIASSNAEVDLSNGQPVNSKEILLTVYFKNWAEVYKQPYVTQRTYLKYENAIENIGKYFKDETLQSLSKIKYQQIINEFSKTHASETVSRLNSYIRASIINAVDEKIIPLDFTKGAVTIGHSPGKSEKNKFLNYDDFSRLMNLASIKITPKYVTRLMIYVAGMTGLRFGELSGLTWDCIDFDKATLSVEKTYNPVTKGFDKTKTESSVRTIAIDSKTKEILINFHASQIDYLKQINILNNSDLVFFNPQTGVVTNNAALHTLTRLQEQLNIVNKISMHGLRHTHASILILKGVNILAVSKRLGHKSVDITLNTYAHLVKELEHAQNELIINELESMIQ